MSVAMAMGLVRDPARIALFLCLEPGGACFKSVDTLG